MTSPLPAAGSTEPVSRATPRDAGSRCCSSRRRPRLAYVVSSSTKLIHGGLRYLEYYEFGLVAEALRRARDPVARRAAHHCAPAVRAAARAAPAARVDDPAGSSSTIISEDARRCLHRPAFTWAKAKWGAGLKTKFDNGFVYSDAKVDDARLVVVNALAAKEQGAEIRTRTRVVGARRDRGLWRITLADGAGATAEVRARALVNAAGPWVKQLLDEVSAAPTNAAVRHVKGSHIVVPRVHAEDHAYILQNSDNRIVFVIPYEGDFSLIGTTDIPVGDFEAPAISPRKSTIWCEIANGISCGRSGEDVVWTYRRCVAAVRTMERWIRRR